MTFTSEIRYIMDTRNDPNYSGRYKKIGGAFAQASGDTGGEIDTQLDSIKGAGLTVNTADAHHVTLSSSILTIVTASGVTSGWWEVVGPPSR